MMGAGQPGADWAGGIPLQVAEKWGGRGDYSKLVQGAELTRKQAKPKGSQEG